MYKRQKAILIRFIVVILVTVITILTMVNFKDWINRSEAMLAMEQLGRKVLAYRQERGSVPPESYVDRVKENLQGRVRLGNLNYRALWLDFDSSGDEILAYTEKRYHSLFFGEGFIVLRLDGRVEWMDRGKFETLLAQQQSPMEIEMLRK